MNDGQSGAIDFLGIGATKAGTTWLWRNLLGHPEIWMPRCKELHYFDRSPRYPSPSYLASESLVRRLLGRDEGDRQFRTRLVRECCGSIKELDLKRLKWVARYYFGGRTIEWYATLFRDGADRVKGEITPAYSILDEPDVAGIREAFPELKILFLLRNPIHRTWSHVRHFWTKENSGAESLEALKARCDTPTFTLRSDYLRTMSIWERVFTADRIHYGFYDQIVEEPETLLGDVTRFLGVSPLPPDRIVRQRVNASRSGAMPAELAGHLAGKYRAQIEALDRRFQNRYTRRWLEETESILGMRPGSDAAEQRRHG